MRCLLSLAKSVLAAAMAINPQEAQAIKIAANAAASSPPPADAVAGGSGASPKTAEKHTEAVGDVVPSDLRGSDEDMADSLGRSLEALGWAKYYDDTPFDGFCVDNSNGYYRWIGPPGTGVTMDQCAAACVPFNIVGFTHGSNAHHGNGKCFCHFSKDEIPAHMTGYARFVGEYVGDGPVAGGDGAAKGPGFNCYAIKEMLTTHYEQRFSGFCRDSGGNKYDWLGPSGVGVTVERCAAACEPFTDYVGFTHGSTANHGNGKCYCHFSNGGVPATSQPAFSRYTQWVGDGPVAGGDETPGMLCYTPKPQVETESPTSSPTSSSPTSSSPTREVPPPWTIMFLELIANFTALSYEDLKLSYAVGKGRDHEAFLYQKDCETNITDIAITSNEVRAPKNNTFDFLTLSYNVSKDEIMNSTIWNSTSSAIEVCQVVNLIVPASNGMDKFVLATDVVKTNITFDLTAEIELLVDLQAGAVDNATETIDVADVVEACKCSEDSFDCNSETLAPNNELFICVTSKDASIQVDTLVTMDIEQGNEKLQVVKNDAAKIPGLTSVEFIDGGVRVGTRVPVNKFDFANGASITISGAVDMKLPGLGRRLRALADDGAAAVDENEEAAFELVVNLAEELNAGSSDQVSVTSSGRALGVGVAVLGAVASLAVFSLW